MPIEFTALQRETLTAIVDTFVASVPREDDPDGFYAAKGSDVGADVAAEHYLLTQVPDEQRAGLLQLIDGAGLFGFEDRPSPAAKRFSATLPPYRPRPRQGSLRCTSFRCFFAYSIPGPQGRNPLWAGMGYPGPVQNPPSRLPQDTRGHRRLR